MCLGRPCRVVEVPGDGPRVVTLTVDEQPLPGWAACGGTHAFSVASAVELSRALGRLPEHLVVVGVAGCDFSTGHGLSSDVRGRIDAAVESVRAAVHTGIEGGVP